MSLAEPRLTVWPPLPPLVHLRRPLASLPYPLDQPESRLRAWGRHALWEGVGALGLEPGEEVLAPAYHHGSEIQPLLDRGLTPVFYDSDPGLRPRVEELESLLTPRTRALHLTHFLGFPQDAQRWRRWCHERDLLLIEDAAQSWLATSGGRPVGSFGDVGFVCLYKTYGLPEGAAVVCSAPLESRRLDRRPGAGQLIRKHASWAAGRSALLASAAGAVPRPSSTGVPFALRDPQSMPWRSTMYVLRRIADPIAAERRRTNHATLLRELPGRVPSPFHELPSGASPFAFPVTVEDRDAALASLASENVIALDFWSVGHPSLRADAYPEAAARRSSTIALPVHQELRQRDLERMAGALERADPR